MHMRRSLSRIIPIIVTIIITSLVAMTLSRQTTYAGSGYGNPVDARIIGIAAQGKPTDLIPVIIQLQSPNTIPTGRLSITQKTVYQAQITQQQQQFIQQNQSLITTIKGITKTTPMIFATVPRSNLVMLASHKQIVGVEIDEPHPLELYESGETIGSRTAVLSGDDGTGTSVAILDTGVAKQHLFLEGQVIAEACFSSNITTSNATSYSLCPGGAATSTAVDSGLPCPMTLSGCGHGTHVAGIIAGKRMNPPSNTTWQDSSGHNHTSEMFGVAPGTKIIAVKVFSRFAPAACGSTTTECVMSWTSDQIAALDWLYNNYTTPSWGILAAVNMSLGGGFFTGFCDTLSIKRSIDMLRTVGVATIIASGNGGYTNGISAPACISSAIAVGASQGNKFGQTLDTAAFFSNAPIVTGNQPNNNSDQLLDLMAPGTQIVSAYPSTNDMFVSMSGTSMATPHIVGAWAILKGIHPSASVSTVLRWFRDTGVAIDANNDPNIQLLVPRVNVQAAVDWVLQPGTIATLTAQQDATQVAVQTQTAVRYATQTKAVELTQTQVAISTATQAVKQTATMAVRMTQTAVVQTTRTNNAQLTQTSGAARTATTVWQRTATSDARTATSDARTATAMVVNPTNTAIMAITRTAISDARTATTVWQRTATSDARTATAMVVNPTNTAIMAATRTAVAVNATATSNARTATAAMNQTNTADARTTTAMIVNPTNTAIMAVTRTAISDARTATTEWQRTATSDVRTATAMVVNPTNTAIMAATRTAVAVNATATSNARTATAAMNQTNTADARTATAMVVNPTNTAIMAATRTAVAVNATATSDARTATTAWQRTAISDARTATSNARTATAMVVNPTNTAIVAMTRTAAVAASQTTIAQRTALVIAQRTATPIASSTK